MYSSGLKLGAAAILNQNPFFEMTSRSYLKRPTGDYKNRWVIQLCRECLLERIPAIARTVCTPPKLWQDPAGLIMKAVSEIDWHLHAEHV